jgi:hypothetical protein
MGFLQRGLCLVIQVLGNHNKLIRSSTESEYELLQLPKISRRVITVLPTWHVIIEPTFENDKV